MSRKQLNVTVNEDLLRMVREKLNSPLYKRTIRGSMQALIESLLSKWLHETAAEANPAPRPLNAKDPTHE